MFQRPEAEETWRGAKRIRDRQTDRHKERSTGRESQKSEFSLSSLLHYSLILSTMSPTSFIIPSFLHMSPRIIQVPEPPPPWSLALSLGCRRTWAGLNVPLPDEHSFSPGLQRSEVAALFTHSHALPAPLLSSFFIMETAQWPQAPWETPPHLPPPGLQTQTLVCLQ